MWAGEVGPIYCLFFFFFSSFFFASGAEPGKKDSGSCQDLVGVRHGAADLAGAGKHFSALLFLAPGLFGLLLALLLDVGGVAESSEADDGHEGDAEGGAADEDPAEALDVGFHVAAEDGGDFVVDFLDLGVVVG